jgi:hypothetical protein
MAESWGSVETSFTLETGLFMNQKSESAVGETGD